MSYTRESFVLHSAAPDLVPADAPAEVWNSVRNAVFRASETLAVAGDLPIFSTSSEVDVLVYVEPFDTGYWVFANGSGIWATDGDTTSNITPVSGWTGSVVGATWSADAINGLAVINCSARTPVWWDGNPAHKCVALPGWPAGGRCLALRGHKNFLFAIGFVSEAGCRVRWSSAAEAGVIPQEWTPSSENEAGFLDLAPVSADCLDGLTMRDDLLIYKRDSVWALTLVDGNDVFSARVLFAERGLAATNAVTRGPSDEHLFVGSDGDIHLTDGVSVQSVLDGRAQRAFYADFSQPSGGVYCATTLSREKLGIVGYPGAGSSVASQALLFDFSSGDIGFRDLPDTLCLVSGRMLTNPGSSNQWDGDGQAWSADQTAWNRLISSATVDDVLIGTAAGPMLLGGGANALPASLEKSGLAFGNPQARKLVARLWPKVTGRRGDVLSFRVGGQELTGGSVDLSDAIPFEIGAELPVDVLVQGRFLTVIVESSGAAAPWRMGSIDVEFRELGGW